MTTLPCHFSLARTTLPYLRALQLQQRSNYNNMEGSSPASADYVAAVNRHSFLSDFQQREDLLSHLGSMGRLGAPPHESYHHQHHTHHHHHNHHNLHRGVTTRSTYQRQTRARPEAETPSPLPSISFSPPPSVASLTPTSAAMAAAHDSRKRRAASAKTTGLPAAKKRRSEPIIASNLKAPPPGSETPVERSSSTAGLKNDSDYGEEDAQPNCCICMCEPEPVDLAAINGCQHKFCFDCIEKWADRENTCPLCKVRFSKIDRVNKPRRKKGEPSRKSSKQVKMRDQRSIPESALEGLVGKLSHIMLSGLPVSWSDLSVL